MNHRIAISQPDYPDADVEKDVFDVLDAEVVVGHVTSDEELVELAAGADVLLVEYAQVTESVLNELNQLTIVSKYGIGVDNADVAAATDRGVTVTNVPSYCEEEVARISLLLTIIRRTAVYTAAVKSGVRELTVGIGHYFNPRTTR